MPTSTQNSPAALRSKVFFSTGLMCGFLLLGAITLFHHEMWRDELQTWMTVKHSHSFSELLENKKYDGHPILWYLFPYFASKFTGNPLAMQIIHLLIAGGTVYLFTNYSPFSRLQKALFAFGYFALYEYAVIARNYAIGIFFLFLFLSFYGPRKRPGWLLPCLLAICAQANVYSLMLSIWLGSLYYMTLLYTKRTGVAFTKKEVFLFLFGVSIFLSGISLSVIQMIPPPGSWPLPPILYPDIDLAKGVLTTLWTSYVPIPSSAMHFWQTNIIASLNTQVVLSVVLFLFFLFAFIKKPLVAISYGAATMGLFLFFYTRYFGYLRHHGHLFIVLVICFWLYSRYSEYKIPNRLLENIAVLLQRVSVYCFTFILILQVIAGLCACVQDWKYPFSASKKVAEYLVEQKLAQKPIIGCLDYVASAVAARLDTPIYYPQSGRLGTYLIFDGRREELLRQYGHQEFVDIILDRSYDYMLNKKEDVLLLFSFAIERTKYPIIPIRTFTASIQSDEIYTLYLMKYPNLSKQGKFDESIREYNKILQKFPDDPIAHNSLGIIFAECGRLDEAIVHFTKALQIKPDYAEAHHNLGTAYSKLGRYEDAIESFKQAIRIKPDYAEAHYNLGVICNSLGRYQDAIESFKQAIRIKPDYAEAHYNLGVFYDSLGRRQDAIETYKQAIRIKPDLAEAHYNLGIVYFLTGDKGSALEECKILKNLDAELANELLNLINK